MTAVSYIKRHIRKNRTNQGLSAFASVWAEADESDVKQYFPYFIHYHSTESRGPGGAYPPPTF